MSDKEKIDLIAQRYAIAIRRADVIDYDPEGQRIKNLLKAACWEAYELTHAVDAQKEQSNAAFMIPGVNVPAVSQTYQTHAASETTCYIGICSICGDIHDPRCNYDHVATPPIELRKKHR